MIKRNLLLILLTALVGIAVLNASSSNEQVNTISDINNGIEVDSLKQVPSLSIEEIKTEFVILNLWASWCIPCQNEVDELLKIFQVNISRDSCVLNYCGGGIAASLEAFVLYQLGFENITIYDNSLHEWAANDQTLPMENN